MRLTRAIYYVSDDARAYSLQGKGSSLGATGTVEAVGDGTTASINASAANQVDFTLSSKGIPAADVLGYEITRCMIEGGKTVKEPVGFATENTFSDTVYINNRVVWYEVTVIDKYLNRSAVKTLEPIKIEHDGRLEKSFWTVSAKNLTAKAPDVQPGTDNDPCEPKPEDVAMRLIDGKADTVYTAEIGGAAEIVIEFNKTLTVSGFKQQAAAGTTGGYRIQAFVDGIWLEGGKGSFDGDDTVHFKNEKQDYVCTYRATALKLIPDSTSGQISIAELEVLGVTSDNVDFIETAGTTAIGRLTEDYQYGKEAEDVIPAGSIVFTGSFKGNPAYNVVLLYDQDGNNVGSVDADGNVNAGSIILADVPAEGLIPNVRKGTWIYWIPAGQEIDLSKITKVRAELYRVNDAATNAGQRLVSDSLFKEMPKELPGISFSGGKPETTAR